MGREADKVHYIDAARGVAILLVVICHAAQPFRLEIGRTWTDIAMLGQYGVQLFFAASALTLCMAWDRDSRLGAFWVRRLFRIVPMYYVGILLYWGWFSMRGEAELYTPGNLVSNAALVHGLILDAHNSVVPGGWSIGTEVLFYCVFPFVVGPLLRLGRSADWALPALACAWAAFIGWAWPWTEAQASFRYHSLALQLPVFLMGFWVYLRPALRWRQDLVAVVLVAACWALIWKLRSGNPLMLGLVAALVLRVLRHLGDAPAWLRRVGQVSFSMYVVHFILAFFVAPWLVSGFGGRAFSAVLGIGLTILLSYLVALATEAAIERPMIKLGRRLSSPALSPA